MKNKKMAFHFTDASFYKFESLLENKVISYGGIVESVDTFYYTTRSKFKI